MSWVDLVDSTEGVRAIYGYHAPRLGGAWVDEIYLKYGRNSVDLRFDITDLPATMPKKWAQRGADTVHLHITFSDVESLVIRGQSSRKVIDLGIDPLEGRILVTARSDHFELDMRAERALLQRITAHRGGPFNRKKPLRNR
ncbi:Imm50 family immunity protein [Actinopolyspora halophila]|uniref:Imm50 family immunity protein n=1 Tax=Actinopolyspora halophila TaxID=1850 RepID=UPI0009FF129A|nr:Imm50 family immunity protein [Actinopolyspora halophila]